MKKTITIALAVVGIVFIGLNFNNKETEIGVIAPLTGIASSYGEDIKSGVMSHSDAMFEDDGCEPSKAISAFNKLTKINNIHMIIGPGCGSPQEAIVPLLKDSDSVVLVPSAASKDLFDMSNGKFFNMQYSLEDEASFLTEEIKSRNYKNIVLISYKNSFSQVLTKSFKENFKDGIVNEIEFIDSKSDISTEIIKLKGQNIDAIVSTDITFFFQQGVNKLNEFNIKSPIYSVYVTELPAVRKLVEGVYYSYPGDLDGEKGATYEISKQSAVLAKAANKLCGNDISCIKKYFIESGKFDSNGVYKRTIILKRIQEGQAMKVK
jgi:ABC-type branched-subunit amino acid transport system substrate-binding protein